ncbi:adhesion G-protein coupled receptor G1-like [Betta splendens]|uniref:Adhesion G-protein coupled receptor G1-like n=1 Tax=Betta splendens TaxID=158456 RepID=A0A6P7LYH2_BETSP|nr:adhesion G-protein coupled receptor G1-like [Betta splendens]
MSVCGTEMLPVTLLLIALIRFSTIRAADPVYCENVPKMCRKGNITWIRCFEEQSANCQPRMHEGSNWGNSSQSINVEEPSGHHVHIPSTVFRRGRARRNVMVVVTTISSEHFKLAQRRSLRKINQPPRVDGSVMNNLVLAVKTVNYTLRNLDHPITLTFKSSSQVKNGTCVFWHESDPINGTGYWSTEGCNTSYVGTGFLCSCNHLSFFAVLVNPSIKLDKHNATYLSYLSYIGSALSAFLTIITLIIYICLQRKRPEKAIGVHLQLTVALLCLHLSFLLCSFWVRLDEDEDKVCQAFGLFLHWSLLASITWMALEGFHLYLLLVRVFNIYVRRYLLKLSLVGWGFPTLIAAVCGFSGVYGKYKLGLTDTNHNLTMCWMSSQFPQKLNVVSYITVVGFPSLVILCNSCMLGVVVFKLWGLRRAYGGWNKTHKEKGTTLWKDCATVVGLSFVLGLPWGLTATTYVSLAGIYIFTVLNSLQGVFIFLWSVAQTCKSRDDNNSSVKDPSTQKMMMTSLNNSNTA